MYRERSTGRLITESQIRAERPNTSFPKPFKTQTIEELELDPVFDTPKPESNLFQASRKCGVEQIDGKWYHKWEVVDRFEDVKDGPTKDGQETDTLNAYKAERKASVKTACREHILARCDAEQQRNAIMGILSQSELTATVDFIFATRTEKRRIYELIDAASLETIDGIIPNWPKAE